MNATRLTFSNFSLNLQSQSINRTFDNRLIWAPITLKDEDVVLDSGTGSGNNYILIYHLICVHLMLFGTRALASQSRKGSPLDSLPARNRSLTTHVPTCLRSTRKRYLCPILRYLSSGGLDQHHHAHTSTPSHGRTLSIPMGNRLIRNVSHFSPRRLGPTLRATPPFRIPLRGDSQT